MKKVFFVISILLLLYSVGYHLGIELKLVEQTNKNTDLADFAGAFGLIGLAICIVAFIVWPLMKKTAG